MKSYYTIGEISKMFNIPSSTIRFWDDEGCIHLNRTENGYRCFDLRAMIDLCRLILYRDLEVPIKSMKELPEMGLNDMNELLENTKQNMLTQLEDIKQKIAAINEKQQLIQLHEKLEISSYIKSEIPFEKIVRFGFENAKLLKDYFKNQHKLVLVMKEENNYLPIVGFAVPHSYESNSVLWHKGNNDKFVQFLLKIQKNDVSKNDLKHHMDILQKDHSKPKIVIAQYLNTNLTDGILIDYNCAWAEITV